MNLSAIKVITLTQLVQLITAQLSPLITHISTDKRVNIGDAVDLKCSVQYPGNYPVSWVKINREDPSKSLIISARSLLTITDSRYSIRHDDESSTYTLQITKIQDIDAGSYQCQVNIGVSNVISASLDLFVNVAPRIADNSTRNVIASLGASITLSCYADGRPQPTIKWRRENNDILPTGNTVYLGNTLAIHNVTRQDRGTYYCVASNEVSKDAKRNVIVEVEFMPDVITPKEVYYQAENYAADLHCQISAFPAPLIAWYKDLIQLYENEDYKIVQSVQDNNYIETTLRINSIRRSQYGRYSCRASNKLGTREKFIELKSSGTPVCPPACGISAGYSNVINMNIFIISFLTILSFTTS